MERITYICTEIVCVEQVDFEIFFFPEEGGGELFKKSPNLFVVVPKSMQSYAVYPILFI